MVKYIFNLKSIDVCNEDKATEVAEWTDDGKDNSVYAALGYSFEHDSDGYILFNGEFPHDSDIVIEKQKISEYDIVRVLSELRHDFDLYFEGDFSINIDGEITSFDSAGDIIKQYREVEEPGTKKQEVLSDDFNEGPYQLHHKNGNIKEKGFYKDGELHGTRKMFYENGNILVEMHYENGKIHGLKKLYHDNGKLKEESNWENDDLITGSVRNFDEDGKLI
tara:strand:- start:19 stop:681 length:663 start_codon:yes stop_codon:yes gene_type:complete